MCMHACMYVCVCVYIYIYIYIYIIDFYDYSNGVKTPRWCNLQIKYYTYWYLGKKFLKKREKTKNIHTCYLKMINQWRMASQKKKMSTEFLKLNTRMLNTYACRVRKNLPRFHQTRSSGRLINIILGNNIFSLRQICFISFMNRY